MKIKNSLIDLSILFIIVIFLALNTDRLGFPYLVHPSNGLSAWKLLVHEGFNTTFWWLDSGTVFSLEHQIFGLTLSLCTLILSSYLYLSPQAEAPLEQKISALALSISLPFLLVILFNLDYPVIIIISQALTTILAIDSFRYFGLNSSCRPYFQIILAAVINLLLCTQYSPYFLFIILLGAITAFGNSRGQARYSLVAITCLLGFFLAWTMLIESYRPSLPEFGYPGTARVVADDGMPGHLTPLIGESTVVPFTDRIHLKQTYSLPVTLFSILAICSLFVAGRKHAFLSKITLMIVAALYWDTHFSEQFSTIGPLETIRRITPGLFPLFTTPIAFGVLISLLAITLSRHTLRILIPVLITFLTIPTSIGATSGVTHVPLKTDVTVEQAVLASPSLAVLKEEDISILYSIKERSKLDAVSPEQLDAVVITSHRNLKKRIAALSDSRPDTRWSPRRGAQYGDEWIEVQLKAPFPLAGIQLLPGKFFSDFPRGLAIDSCTPDKNSNKMSYTRIKETPHWQGGIDMSPLGYPYFTGQHDVIIIFPKQVKVSCIRISQIAEDLHYDWSVAELRLLRFPN